MYFVVPRVILFREEHTRRVFVEKVDFISAPGVSPAGVYRTGGPHAMLTGLCETPMPDASCLEVLRGRVIPELAETYPDFAAQLKNEIDPQYQNGHSFRLKELNKLVE